MLIAQITDIHLGFEPGNPDETNRQRLDRVLAELTGGRNRPDLMVATGDLADRGDAESYARLAEALGACPFPVYPCLGNHDDRANFARAFPQVPLASGFVQYGIDLPGLRIIVLDTLEVGRHGGGFCEVRAAWLGAQLAKDSDTPTVIVMHHPPLDVGIEWMDPGPDQPWIARFTEAIAGHRQIRAIWCGHLHRPIVTLWNGIAVTIGGATGAELSLDLSPIDPDRPDGRPMVSDGPPGYTLHRWEGARLASHVDTVQDLAILAAFDDGMQPLVRQMFEERSG
jgi:3',5'-cyclic AMP phosphodiesterase CpdA